MNFKFDPGLSLIIVQVELHGPDGNLLLQLALDTGATDTLVNQNRLIQLGYDPASSPAHFQVATASGVEFVPHVPLDKIVALGQERTAFLVLSHTLPPSVGVDGLLGLDFLRGHILTIDFHNGSITLA